MKNKILNQEEKINYLLTAPIQPLVWKMAIPTMISMLISSFYQMADTFFISYLGTQATAALGITFPIMTLIQAFGFFFGHGSGNYIARKLGQKEVSSAEAMASCGFFHCFFMGILFLVLGHCFIEPISLSLGATPSIFQHTIDYLKILFWGTPFMMCSLVLNNQLRFQGSASIAMLGIMSGAIFNIVLDPILIFGFSLGIKGAALATIISQLISFCILYFSVANSQNIKIRWKNYNFHHLYVKELFHGGIPTLFRQGLASIAQISLNHSIPLFSDPNLIESTLAGMTIVSRITQLINSTILGFGQGFQPICGINYGAGKFHRVKIAYLYCLKVSTVFLLFLTMISLLLAPEIINIFQKDDLSVLAMGTTTLQIHALSFPLLGSITLSNMFLQSTGKSFKASIISAARQGFFYLSLLWIIPYFYGILGIQVVQPIADFLTFLLGLFFIIIELKSISKSPKMKS